MFTTLGVVLACLAVFVGGHMQIAALGELLPEFKAAPPRTVFWTPSRFTPKGQVRLRRAWRVQLAGLGILALVGLLEAVV